MKYLGSLYDIQTINIIPVDLNCILHLNAATLSTWFEKMGNTNKADKYRAIARELLNSIQEVKIIFLTIFCYPYIKYLFFKKKPIYYLYLL